MAFNCSQRFFCRFINQKHHNRQWLNPVRSVAGIDKALDDNDGVRTTAKIDNVQGKIVCTVKTLRSLHACEQRTVFTVHKYMHVIKSSKWEL